MRSAAWKERVVCRSAPAPRAARRQVGADAGPGLPRASVDDPGPRLPRLAAPPGGRSVDTEAVPLEAEIDQFWAWFSPGFWAAHLEFDYRIRLQGPTAPFADGREFKGYVRLGTSAASGRAWLNTVHQGPENLHQDITSQLVDVAASPAAR